jgi:hypothetical protein
MAIQITHQITYLLAEMGTNPTPRQNLNVHSKKLY